MSAKSKNQYRSAITLDGEIAVLREEFKLVKDNRAKNASHKMSDILMSGFAMFSLKYSSLLDFEQQNQVEAHNLATIYGIQTVCSDTQLREVLDQVDPSFIRQIFPKKFAALRKTGILDEFGYKIGGTTFYIVSCDGVQHFSSKKIGCNCCLTKEHKDGSTTYHHNMLCAASSDPTAFPCLPNIEHFRPTHTK
jgi:hypothetical protein